MRGIMISSGFRGFEVERVRGCHQSPCARYDAIRSEMLSFAFTLLIVSGTLMRSCVGGRFFAVIQVLDDRC